jgi:putative beta-lysine N-acetyltransferase
MHLHPQDFPGLIDTIETLSIKNGYTKIFAKIPAHLGISFKAAGYELEAMVPGFFNGEEDAFFMARYLEDQRRKPNRKELEAFQQLLMEAVPGELAPLGPGHLIRKLGEKDTGAMIAVFRRVFDSYPFPIFDPQFLIKSMKEETRYFGLFQEDELVGISSAECNDRQKYAEMTDFAVLPGQRGKNIATHLLREMEAYLLDKGFKTLYTIARLKSLPMNKTFLISHYRYAGTLTNNTQIAGRIESMNVWYKNV